ncbi:MBL fold metallo-hydrolase [Chitinophaga sp. HK235]|uniref:MBL fold metallo-hydrolase n=1 Tax=Chitinophaga sp. HK235 TaxID=2952571 RepID=UPI001BAA1096|nr:MBL fold metallo-hydrolase [Chitinophaga sp. HK235]
MQYLSYQLFPPGDMELFLLSDGHQVMAPAHPILGPYAPSEQVQQLLLEHSLSPTHVHLDINILLLRKKDRLILIDCGLGQEEPTAGLLPQSLAAAGFQPEDITDILITHAHTDHIGGLLRANGTMVFPNAHVYMTKTEYNFWMSGQPDFSASPLHNQPAITAALVNRVREILTTATPQLQLVKEDEILFDCIRLIPAPGHTPGHVMVDIHSGGISLLHTADLLHSGILLQHPEWGMQYDINFHQAVTTRRNTLAAQATSGKMTMAYHMPWPGLGYIKQRESAFEWEPVNKNCC